jgi:mono/diheme cytochrome c family protein
MPQRLFHVGRSIVLIASVVTTPALAAEADPVHGETLAKRWCTSCHLVGTDQKSASTDAPPFAVVANRPDFNTEKLAFFLLDPHPKMPNMSLSRTEAADLAAYISTLGPHRRRPQPATPAPTKRSDAAIN